MLFCELLFAFALIVRNSVLYLQRV